MVFMHCTFYHFTSVYMIQSSSVYFFEKKIQIYTISYLFHKFPPHQILGKKLIYIPDLDQICLMIICLKWKFVFLGTWRLCWITTSGLYTTHGNSCPRSVKSLISQIIDMKTLSQYPKTYVRNSGILNRFCCQYSWSIWCYRASLVCPGETHQ